MISKEVEVINVLEPIVDFKAFRWTIPSAYADQYPYIRVAELDNRDNDYRDNKPTTSDIPIQVDLWAKGDPTNLQNQIDKLMKSLGFERSSVNSFYEEDTGVMRKAMRYTIKANLEEE